ncbi:20-hydroxyecdysone protein [Teleopsis dalmanni]|uniref:20-hydroxyecdysone protein n=1 Tax=Teleopsis dalmanni TaxID=139649 RepID=UPI0018CD1E47|nr:20-hydroxyecdysone protein [Teleopsis dalmanni]
MRAIFVLTLSLLLLINNSQAGLVHRRFRDLNETPAIAVLTSEPVAAELRKDQIPVTILELEEPQTVVQPLDSERRVEPALTVSEPQAIATDNKAPQKEGLKAAAETAEIAEEIASAVEQDQKLRAASAITEAQANIEQPTEQQLAEAPLTKNTAPQLTTEQNNATPLEAAVPAVVAVLAPPQQPFVKSVPSVNNPEVAQPAEVVAENVAEKVDANADAVSNVRQATQATPTTTQQNFVQQLQNTIQNSPIGQFLNQITGQQQNNNQQQPAADEPASPNPTLPGFLNPAAAITSAQQAVQNVVNSTTQAFQGLQQFASNIGTQFQNTLSNLGNQQNQLTTSDSTTTRPPGPFQAIVSTFTGGNNNNNQPADAAPGQPQGPLQGIISFFQGGARPTAAPVVPVVQTTAGPAIVEPVAVDDKIDEASNDDAQVEPDSDNEVRNSEEVVLDSSEEAQQSDMIVVNDDVNQQDAVAA